MRLSIVELHFNPIHVLNSSVVLVKPY